MTGTTISTVSTTAISLTSASFNPVNIEPTGGINVTSGLYALASDSTGFFVQSTFTIYNFGGVISDTAPNSFGITLKGGGTVNNSDGSQGFPTPRSIGTISGSAHGVAISDGPGTVFNSATIQATAPAGVGVGLYAGGIVSNSLYQAIPHVGIPGVIQGGASAAAVRITGGTGSVSNYAGTIGAGASIGVYLGAGGSVENDPRSSFGFTGTISGTQYGILAKGGATTVTNFGVIIGGTDAVSLPPGYANRVRVFPRATFNGTIDGGNTVGAAVGSTLELSGYGNNTAYTLSGIGGTITNFSTIAFGFNDLWSLTGNKAGLAGGEVFNNFAAGDTINITGFTNETIAGFSANTLTLGGSSPLDLIVTAPGANAANFRVYNDATNGIDVITNLASQACFAAGTRILTDRGEVAVERLHEGDHIVTALNGGTAPIVWIGRRHVRPRQHPRPEAVRPVVVQPGAFGPGLPHRALRLSPDHAVFVDGVLIPVGLLINGHGIVQEDVTEVTYFHMELPEHEVLYAEGLACESYLATGDVTAFDNRAAAVALHPSFAPAAVWETRGCAPLIKTGALLDAVRERLSARTVPLAAVTRAA